MIDLTAAQWQALEQLMITVLPRDEQPGAAEAGVMCFLRRALPQGRWSTSGELLTSGLRTLDALAQQRCGAPFAACGAGDRDAIVAWVQRVPQGQTQRFLALAIEMALTGFLCEPRHGGNRQFAGWKTIGWHPVDPSRM
jgi:gluconate 2-dehydrogenase gamma chain